MDPSEVIINKYNVIARETKAHYKNLIEQAINEQKLDKNIKVVYIEIRDGDHDICILDVGFHITTPKLNGFSSTCYFYELDSTELFKEEVEDYLHEKWEYWENDWYSSY